MKFLNPYILYALIGLLIPIVIHLFNFRRYKTIYFSNVSFLKDIKKDSQSTSVLKHLLVLLCRFLAYSFIIFAFAQPFIPNGNQHTADKKFISLYLDNSFSMEGLNSQGQLLELAKQQAHAIVDAYENKHEFQVLTNDFEARHQRSVSKSEIHQLIDEVKISSQSKVISKLVLRQQNAFRNSKANYADFYIVSDFQKSISDLELIESNENEHIHFLKLQNNEQNNLYIDSCYFVQAVQKPGQTEELKVKLVNNSAKQYNNIPVTLKINGKQKALNSVALAPNSSEEVLLRFTNQQKGINKAELSITDHPISFDDKFYFNFSMQEEIELLLIKGNSENTPLKRLFSDSYFKLEEQTVQQLDFSSFGKKQLIILNGLSSLSSGLQQALKTYISKGGKVLLFPAENSELNSYNKFLSILNAGQLKALKQEKIAIKSFNASHILFNDVFEEIDQNISLPQVFEYFPITQERYNTEEPIYVMENDLSFLSSYRYESGQLYLCSSPLNEKSNLFSKHALFVPTLYNIATQQSQQKLYYTIGQESSLEIAIGDQADALAISGLDYKMIPAQQRINNNMRISIGNYIPKAGHYMLTQKEQELAGISFNYDRKESALTYIDQAELNDFAAAKENYNTINFSESQQLTASISEQYKGKQYWKHAIILALIFLSLEMILLKFFNR